MNDTHQEVDLRVVVMPPVFDKLCCSVGPLMFLFAASVLEYFFPSYALLVRLGGLVIIGLLLARELYHRGVVSMEIARAHRTKILLIALYTYFLSVALYFFFVYFATPNIISYANTSSILIQ